MADLAPDGDPRFVHTAEGPDDMPAHVRSVLTRTDVTIPVRDGRLALGTWQGVYLWEHRLQPHRRRVLVTVEGRARAGQNHAGAVPASAAPRCRPRLELQRAARDFREARGAHLLHHDLELAIEDVEHALDARLTERAKAPDVRSADPDRLRAERECLEHVRAAAKAAVDDHGHAAVHGLEHLRERVDRAAQRLVRAPAVVRHDDSVRAVRERTRGVLARDDALDEHLHRRRLLELVDVVPGESRDGHVHAFEVDAIEHVLRLVRTRRARLVARSAKRIMFSVEARARLEVSRRHVDGQRERGAARVLRAFDHAERDVPVSRRVELKPNRRAARLAHVLDRVVANRREDLELVLRLRRARGGHLAFGIERLLRADGAEQDRGGIALPEELHGHVDVRYVDEPLRPERYFLEACAVRGD